MSNVLFLCLLKKRNEILETKQKCSIFFKTDRVIMNLDMEAEKQSNIDNLKQRGSRCTLIDYLSKRLYILKNRSKRSNPCNTANKKTICCEFQEQIKTMCNIEGPSF